MLSLKRYHQLPLAFNYEVRFLTMHVVCCFRFLLQKCNYKCLQEVETGNCVIDVTKSGRMLKKKSLQKFSCTFTLKKIDQ